MLRGKGGLGLGEFVVAPKRKPLVTGGGFGVANTFARGLLQARRVEGEKARLRRRAGTRHAAAARRWPHCCRRPRGHRATAVTRRARHTLRCCCHAAHRGPGRTENAKQVLLEPGRQVGEALGKLGLVLWQQSLADLDVVDRQHLVADLETRGADGRHSLDHSGVPTVETAAQHTKLHLVPRW